MTRDEMMALIDALPDDVRDGLRADAENTMKLMWQHALSVSGGHEGKASALLTAVGIRKSIRIGIQPTNVLLATVEHIEDEQRQLEREASNGKAEGTEETATAPEAAAVPGGSHPGVVAGDDSV